MLVSVLDSRAVIFGGTSNTNTPMSSFNKVILLGNLTRDPEMRVTPKGTAVTKFGLAVSRKYRAADGTEAEDVTFVDVEAWGKQAETINKFCVKGRPLMLEGRLQLDSWEDKATKQKRSKLKVFLESFTFLPGGKREGGNGSSGAGEAEAGVSGDAPSDGGESVPF